MKTCWRLSTNYRGGEDVSVGLRGEHLAPEGKKRSIMEAALAVLAEKGYHLATIDEIAERAGVGKGTIYVYFESKAALVGELIDTVTRMHLMEMEESIARIDDAREKLLILAGAEYDFMRRNGPLVQILTSGETMGLAPEFRTQMQTVREGYVKLIERVIREGQSEGVFSTSISPVLAATIIFGARIAVTQLAYEAALESQANTIRNQVVDFILRGLGAST